MSEQLSLLDWRPPADILPFPLHRSHGLTACAARALADVDTPKRTGRLNSLRAQTRRRLEPLIGADAAEDAADAYVRMIRIHFAYCERRPFSSPKPIDPRGQIISLQSRKDSTKQYGGGAGAAGALGRGAKLLAGLGGAHETPEYDAAHAREGGAA